MLTWVVRTEPYSTTMASTGVEVRSHDPYCSCDHTACEKLKGRFFCRRWYFFSCVGTVSNTPGAILNDLRCNLKIHDNDNSVRVFGVRMATGSLCFLISFGGHGRDLTDSSYESTMRVQDFASKSKVNAAGTFLGCCAEQVHFNARDWLGILERLDNVSSFGDSSILSSFREDVQPYVTYERLLMVD